MQNKRRVVVTGIGIISPIGANKEEYLDSLKAGRSGVGQVTKFDTSKLRTHIAAEIKNFKPLEALDQALKDSNLNLSSLNPTRAGTVIGTLRGNMFLLQKFMYKRITENQNDSDLLAKSYPAYYTDQIYSRLNLQGPKATVATACSAGTNALGYAFDLIRSNQSDIIIAGGIEEMSEYTFGGFTALRALAPDACRPFDKNRSGLVVGEGSAILILESFEHAQQRSVPIYAEILGYGLSADAHHQTAPDSSGEGQALAMEMALKDAGISPEEVDYINAHGTGTPQNDLAETRAIKRVFKDYAYKVPISSTKSMIGHTMGASGALEAVACVLAMQYSFIPPTINYQTPDPECDLDYVPNAAREVGLKIVMSNSFAFGGNNAAIVLLKHVKKRRRP